MSFVTCKMKVNPWKFPLWTCTKYGFYLIWTSFNILCFRPATLLRKWLWHRCCLKNFAKFLFYRTPPVAANPICDYLHCAVPKALHSFREERALKSRDMQFFLQNFPNKIFRMFENNMKFTRAACWINSTISNRDKNTTLIIFLFVTISGRYYSLVIESL